MSSCDVRGPLVNMRAGDTVWCYTAELDVGVFAVGRARAPSKEARPTITVMLERTRSKVFAGDPLPGATIRRWVPELREGAVSLDLRPRALAVLDAWQRERGERDVELLTPIRVDSMANRARQEDAHRSWPAVHDVLAPVARLLRSQDFAIGVDRSPTDEPRLVARRVRDVVVVDVCRPRRRWRPRPRPRGARAPAADAVAARARGVRRRSAAGDALARVLGSPTGGDRGLPGGLGRARQRPSAAGVVELTDRSKQRWYQALGVR